MGVADKVTLLQHFAKKIYTAIALVYPVCSYSDEFYFFPQYVLENQDWSAWDDFSEGRIVDFVDCLKGFEGDLAAIELDELSDEEKVDVELLLQVLKTLREQLTCVAPHRTQPTFHLTVLAVGLTEALGSGVADAWLQRVRGAPTFLKRAVECLENVPVLFLNLGKNMLKDLQVWVEGLDVEGYPCDDLKYALCQFGAALDAIQPVGICHLQEEPLDVLLREHLGCGLGVTELQESLRQEFAEMSEVLDAETMRLAPGKHWHEAEQHIPFVVAAGGALCNLYSKELARLEKHCRRHNLVPREMSQGSLEVTPVPEYLSAIRASDAYAAMPGHPSRGGIFYVMEEGRSRDGQPGRTLEYRMTAVHEAWPGHHLLDSCRWALQSPLRRPIESPLFYEGWACLSEEIMTRTGYLDGPWDRYMLAKRRIERAARGLVDMGLQSGQMTFAEAGNLLVEAGYRREHAVAVVPRYLLRPGYQVCYTLGLKQGLGLLEQFGQKDVGCFARTLLEQGEIGFSRLEKVFLSKQKEPESE